MSFLRLASVLLVLAAVVSCRTTTGTGEWALFGDLMHGSACLVRSGTDAMTDAEWHSLTCTGGARGGAELLIVCKEGEMVASLGPVNSGMVEYRFDDQPIVREEWQLDGRRAVSVEAAPAILTGLASADRFRFRVDGGGTTDIGLTGKEGETNGAAAVVVFA